MWVIVERHREYSTGARESQREAAEKFLARFLVERHKPEFRGGDPDTVLIADALDEYQTNHGAKTKRPDKIGISVAKLLDFFGTATVATITPARCDAYIEWRTAQFNANVRNGAARPISLQTARVDLVTLKAALGYCFANGKLTRLVPIKLPRMGHPRERHLTRSEAARLLGGALGFYVTGKSSVRTRKTVWQWRRDPRCISRHLARFILLGLYTATRHAAILNLQWIANVNGGWIDVGSEILHRRPQRAQDSAKRKPPLPIPARLLPHVRRWQRLGGRFVVEFRGARVLKERTAWEGARELAYLGPDVTPHILRHTCATWLLQAGRSTWEVAGVLGCSEDVVRETYGHHARAGLRATTDAFSARPGRALPYPTVEFRPHNARRTPVKAGSNSRKRSKKPK